MTETFSGTGYAIAGTQSATGLGAVTGGAAALDVRFDAVTGRYTLATPTGATLELAGAPTRNAMVDRFSSTSGDVVNTVQLTRTGTDTLPGTAQVAGVLWDRRSGPTDSRQIDARAAVFGVPTPVADVPRTGTASFAVVVNTVEASSGGTVQGRGSGLLTVDLAANSWNAAGTMNLAAFASRFAASGTVAASDRTLAGTIRLGLPMSSTDIPLSGRFFGPGAAEVGASFGAGSGSSLVVGTLLGRRGTTAPVLETLDRLLAPVTLRFFSASLVDRALLGSGPRSILFNSGSESSVEIDPAAQTIRVSGQPPVGPEQRVAGESDARFTTYRVDDGGVVRTYRVFNAGPANPDLATRYVGLVLGDRTAFTAANYGLASGFDFVPRTGRGTYGGVLYGQAYRNDRPDAYALTGTASLIADFAALTLGGTLNVSATLAGVTTPLDPLTVVNGRIGGTTLGQPGSFRSNLFGGELTGAPGAAGALAGNFYGPEVEELGATFQFVAPGAGTILIGQGALVAGRGAIGESPALPPAPTPPSPVNTSLDPIVASETFAADAQRSMAFYPGDGTSPIPARRTGLSVRYDATSQSYTVEESGQSARFAPADRVSGNRLADLFQATSAGGTDTLTLTRTGTGGIADTRHVAGGLWLRDETAGGIRRFVMRSFVFGIPTAAADIPRTGTSRYGVVLSGLVPAEQPLLGPSLARYAGSALIEVNWASPLINSTGIGYRREALPPGDARAPSLSAFSFTLSGILNPSTGAFGGSLSSSTAPTFGGQAEGRLFGPGAAEIGIAASTTSGTPVTSGAAILVGRQASEAPVFETMTSLLGDVSLFSFTAQTFVNTVGTEQERNNGRQTVEVGAGLDRFVNGGTGVGAADLVAAESDARFATYRRVSAGGTTTLRVYRSGSANTELALSYASLMLGDVAAAGGGVRSTASAYGLPALASALPRTGTGAYRGVAYGSGSAGGDAYALRGTASVDVDWATDRLAGTLAMTASNSRTAVSEALGTIGFSGAALDRAFTTFRGDLTGTGVTGAIQGGLFGPVGQEIGGSFLVEAPVTAGTLRAQGAFVGKRN